MKCNQNDKPADSKYGTGLLAYHKVCNKTHLAHMSVALFCKVKTRVLSGLNLTCFHKNMTHGTVGRQLLHTPWYWEVRLFVRLIYHVLAKYTQYLCLKTVEENARVTINFLKIREPRPFIFEEWRVTGIYLYLKHIATLSLWLHFLKSHITSVKITSQRSTSNSVGEHNPLSIPEK